MTARVAAAAGAAWGLGAYAVLWGLTPIVVHRPFVVSFVGTVLLLPARLVLWGVRVVESRADAPFDFSGNHGWIGLLSAAVGAAIVVAAVLLVRFAVGRRFVPSRR